MAPAVASAALLLLNPQAARAADVPVPPSGLISDKGEGAVSAADKDFVTKVRLAGLWEIPAGEMAQEKSKDERIQEIGKDISAQHKVLDLLTRNAAKKLKITLPDEPNKDQQTWLGEMEAADEGEAFDEVYIARLRAAHGKIFPAIATIRASTRNDTVRKLAQQANQFVATHMTLLESSGIVDFKALPTAPNPSASAAPAVASGQVRSAVQSPLSGAITPLLIATLAAVLLVGMLATRFLMGRRSGRRAHRAQP